MKKIGLQIVALLFVVSFYGQTKNKKTTIQKSIEIEGIYKTSYEESSFYEKNGKVLKAPVWMDVTTILIMSPEQKKMLFENNTQGVYLKVIGKIKTGGNYGRLGTYDSELTISKIIAIDPNQTLEDFVINK